MWKFKASKYKNASPKIPKRDVSTMTHLKQMHVVNDNSWEGVDITLFQH